MTEIIDNPTFGKYLRISSFRSERELKHDVTLKVGDSDFITCVTSADNLEFATPKETIYVLKEIIDSMIKEIEK